MPSNVVRARILASGSVQGVGYRYKVARDARKLGIRGTVRNLDDGRVEIFCEADDRKQLDEFVREIGRSDFLIVVEDVQVMLEGQPGYGSHPNQSQKFDVEF
ncbi:Acylphosphatase [uncultured archaeon]|nr:Acylphosphatase [uncultured archaeon]